MHRLRCRTAASQFDWESWSVNVEIYLKRIMSRKQNIYHRIYVFCVIIVFVGTFYDSGTLVTAAVTVSYLNYNRKHHYG